MDQADKGDNVRAVGRALDILLAFTQSDPELTAAELLKRVDLSRSTLYRLLHTLEERGFVAIEGEPQRFRLGPSVARLAHVWQGGLDLKALAEPTLRRIWEITRETVSLFIAQGSERLCVQELPSSQPLNFKRGVGYTEHIARGATGRAILAYRRPTPEQLQAFREVAGIEPSQLLADLEITRRRGYAISHSELITGAVAIAAPLLDARGKAVGSVGVFGPQVRLDSKRQQEIADLLIEESTKLSKELGSEVTR